MKSFLEKYSMIVLGVIAILIIFLPDILFSEKYEFGSFFGNFLYAFYINFACAILIVVDLVVNMKKQKINPIHFIFWPIILFSTYYFNLRIVSEKTTNAVENTINIFIPFAVWNSTIFIILLQENYRKFKSIYLLKSMMLQNKRLWILTLIPMLFLFFNATITEYANSFPPILPLLVFINFSSTLFFIHQFPKILDTKAFLGNLMNSAKPEEFDSYRKLADFGQESIFDDILSIIQSIVKKDDTQNAQSTFKMLGEWLNKNISLINYDSQIYGERQKNRFRIFFILINREVLKSDNIMMHNYYVYFITSMIREKMNKDNYTNYEILYEFLSIYVKERLKRNESDFATHAFDSLYWPVKDILFQIPKERKDTNQSELENKINIFVSQTSWPEGKMFKKIFLDTVQEIIATAVKFNCKDFLLNLRIYETLFGILPDKWDGNIIFDVLKYTSLSIFMQKDRYLIDNDCPLHTFETDFTLFQKQGDYECSDKVIPYIMAKIKELYTYAINNNKKIYPYDFRFFVEKIWDAMKNGNEKQFKLFFNCYTDFFD
ncbi:MAG: hypothetical protein LBM93_13865, partial [Oscillospiraceae bacterium]|nr:hypothetical protein [Oscillospiraceae bacterium]